MEAEEVFLVENYEQ